MSHGLFCHRGELLSIAGVTGQERVPHRHSSPFGVQGVLERQSDSLIMLGCPFGDEVFGYMNTAVCSRQGTQRCIRLCCYQIGRDHNNGACLYWHRVGVLLFAPAIPLSGCLSLDFWLLLHTGQSQTALCPSNPPTPK